MHVINRRYFAIASAAWLALAGKATAQTASPNDKISRANAAIHQEVVFAARPASVYNALVNASEFDKVARASAAMAIMSMTRLGSAPTEIDARPGGAFRLFGGYISGRNVELVSDLRIVQAWRVGDWDAGLYSIAKFALAGADGGTRLLFDHTGFPSEAADHLAKGWYANYWEPLAKILAAS